VLEENKLVLRRFVEEVLNQKSRSAFEELVAADVVNHHAPPGVPTTKEGWRQNFEMFCTGFPDMHWTIDDVVAEEDRVVGRATMVATHQGSFFGIAPTQRVVRVPSIHIMKVRDHQIVEHWGNEDAVGMLAQLGVLAPPA
jgi:predicted ester cyclase